MSLKIQEKLYHLLLSNISIIYWLLFHSSLFLNELTIASTQFTLRHGYIGIPNLNMRFWLQSELFDVKIGPYWLSIVIVTENFHRMRCLEIWFMHWWPTYLYVVLFHYRKLSFSSKHTGAQHPAVCQNFTNCNWIRAILVLDCGKWPFLRVCTFMYPCVVKRSMCSAAMMTHGETRRARDDWLDRMVEIV